jgi:hypothetical protein
MTIGPPTRNPVWFCFSFGLATPLRLLNQVFAFSLSLR